MPSPADHDDSEDWISEWNVVVAQVDGADDEHGGPVWSPDVVERGAVRRYLEPLEFDCPLHYSPDVARAHGYPDVIAPYTSVFTFAKGAEWLPGEIAFPSADRDAEPVKPSLDTTGYPPSATAMFATDFEVEYFRPAVVGERLGGRGALLRDVTPKKTRVGRGAFIKHESTILSQTGGPIATVKTGLYVFEPAGELPTAAENAVPQLFAQPAPAEWTAGAHTAPRLVQRRATEVIIGELIEAVDFPLPVVRLVMAAGANRDFNSIHHNTAAARATMAPDMYANTLFLQGMWERAVRQYIGDAGTIKRITGLKMVSFNSAGDTAIVRGRVTDLRSCDRHAEVDLQMWTENAVGVSVGPGLVTATVPA